MRFSRLACVYLEEGWEWLFIFLQTILLKSTLRARDLTDEACVDESPHVAELMIWAQLVPLLVLSHVLIWHVYYDILKLVWTTHRTHRTDNSPYVAAHGPSLCVKYASVLARMHAFSSCRCGTYTC